MNAIQQLILLHRYDVPKSSEFESHLTYMGGFNVTKHNNSYGNKGTLSLNSKLEPLYIKNGVHLAKFLWSNVSEASREVENFFKRKNPTHLDTVSKMFFKLHNSTPVDFICDVVFVLRFN